MAAVPRIRLREKSPVAIPPQGFVDIYYDASSGSILAKDYEDNPVLFSGSGSSGPIESADIVDASSGGNGSADVGKVLIFASAGGLRCADGVRVFNSLVPGDDITLAANGFGHKVTSYQDPYSGTLDFPAVTANRTWTLPDAAGVVASLRSYADATAANAAVSVGDAWWDTTLKKVRVRLS